MIVVGLVAGTQTRRSNPWAIDGTVRPPRGGASGWRATFALVVLSAMVGGASLSRLSSGPDTLGALTSLRFWLISALALGVLGAKATGRLRNRSRRLDLSWPLVGQIALLHGTVAASTIWSPHPNASVALGALTAAIFAVAATPVVRANPEAAFETLTKTYLVLGAVLLPIAAVSFRSLGEEIQTPLIGSIGLARTFGLAACAALYQFSSTGHRRWLVATAAFGAPSVMSGNRASALALLVAATFVFIYVTRSIRLRFRLMGYVALAGIGATVVPAIRSGIPWFIEAALQVQLRSDSGVIYLADRDLLVGGALDIFRGHWLIGGGLGSYSELTNFVERYPHNLPAEIAASAGIVGLSLLLLISVSAWRVGRQATSIQARMALAYALFGVTAAQFGGTFEDTPSVWLPLIVAAALCVRRRARPRPVAYNFSWPA